MQPSLYQHSSSPQRLPSFAALLARLHCGIILYKWTRGSSIVNLYPTGSTRSKNTMQNLKWHYVPTTDSPGLGKSPRECQRSPVMEPRTNVSIQVATGVSPRTSPETKAGTKVMRSIQRRDDFDQLLQANILHSVLRI